MKSIYALSMMAIAVAATDSPDIATKSESEIQELEVDRPRRLGKGSKGWGGSSKSSKGSWSSSSGDWCEPIIKYIYVQVPWGGSWSGSGWGSSSWGGDGGYWAKVPVDDDDDWSDDWSDDWGWSYSSGKSGKGGWGGSGKSGKGSFGGGKSGKSGGYWAKVPADSGGW